MQADLHAAEDAQGALRKRLAEAERRCAELPALREEAAELVARVSALTQQLAEAEAAPAALDAKDAEISELHRCEVMPCLQDNSLSGVGLVFPA